MFKRITKILAAGIFLGVAAFSLTEFSVASADDDGDDDDKITICHVPSDDPAKARTQRVDEDAWQDGTSAHSSHPLDYVGPCKDPPTEPPPTDPPPTDPPPDPTSEPTPDPTSEPTPDPTSEPTPDPTSEPTPDPTSEPTPDPTSPPCEGECDPTPTATPSDNPGHNNPGHDESYSHVVIPYMWLLTNEADGRWCVLIAESHPSVERQNIKCFEGEDWTATNAPCAGPVYASDVWVCDEILLAWTSARWPDATWLHNPGRLPLEQLRIVYRNHVEKWGPNHQ